MYKKERTRKGICQEMGNGDGRTTLLRIMENLADEVVSVLESAQNACLIVSRSRSVLVEECLCWMSCTMR